uniref:Uncharacterized protein n=1 Tax=Arundo donax TaxID=35708 RepID=A0A0A9AH80_ARUDO
MKTNCSTPYLRRD